MTRTGNREIRSVSGRVGSYELLLVESLTTLKYTGRSRLK